MEGDFGEGLSSEKGVKLIHNAGPKDRRRKVGGGRKSRFVSVPQTCLKDFFAPSSCRSFLAAIRFRLNPRASNPIQAVGAGR